MNTQKFRAPLQKTPRVIFSMVLLLTVFAVASFTRVQAANVLTGWLWGGGAEGDGSMPYDGTNTNVGWISANGDNPEVPGGVEYRAMMSSGNGPVTGYVWSENIGWIQLDPDGPYPAGPNFSTKKAGVNLEGWARIIGISEASAVGNSGGWLGWIKMKGPSYGVAVESDGLAGYAWSDELGWINFDRTGFETVCSLSLSPSSFTLGGSPTTLRATIDASPEPGKIIDFTKSGANPEKFSLSSSTCTINSSNFCEVAVSALDRSSVFTADFAASTSGCVSATSTGSIAPLPTCALTCDSSVQVMPGESAYYAVTANGSGCADERDCQIISGSSKLSADWDSVAGKCKVNASSDARYETAVSTSSAGQGPSSTCETDVRVKPPGWIETNP